MTVSSTINREQYATNGVTTAFTIHFPFFDDTDVNAIFVTSGGVSTTLAINTDFTVTGGAGAGGTLTTAGALSPLATGGTLTIYRDIPFTQEDDYVEDDPLPADTLEGGFDRAAMRDQQLKDAQGRALTFPVTVAAGVSGELPDPIAEYFLRFSADGLSIEAAPVADLGAVTQATESTAGIAKISTQAITNTGTNDTDFLTAKKLNDSTQLSVRDVRGKHSVPIMAAAMIPATTNGAAPGTVETTTNKVLYKTLDFDTSTQEFAGFAIPMPKSWNEGTVTFSALWTAASGSGGVAWALQGLACSDDDAIDTAYGTEQVVTDTLLTAGDSHRTAESSAITIAGTPAASDLVFFRVKRVPANGSDTLAVDARLIGIDIFITTDAATDA